jgi:hypothetical protein
MTEFESVLDEMRDLQARKRRDYGSTSDPLANIRAGAKFAGVPDWVGCMMRANDKMFRLSAAAKGSNLINEGVEDSLLDLAIYSVHALTLYREQAQTIADELDIKIKELKIFRELAERPIIEPK